MYLPRLEYKKHHLELQCGAERNKSDESAVSPVLRFLLEALQSLDFTNTICTVMSKLAFSNRHCEDERRRKYLGLHLVGVFLEYSGFCKEL